MKRKNLLQLLLVILIILFTVSCDKEVSTSPSEPEPPKGMIFVDSEPAGFKIYLDGRFTGRFTPDSIPFIEEKLFEVGLKRNLWKDTSVFIEASSVQPPQIDVNYLVNPSMRGSLNLVSSPRDAKIYINDSLLTETSPTVIKGLLPGSYNVRFSFEQHRDNQAIVAVKSSQVTNVNLALRDTSIWVDYRKLNSPLPTDILTSVAVESSGIVWIGTIDKGIVRFQNNVFQTFDKSNSLLPHDRVTDVFVDENDTKWIGTEGGFARFDDPNNMQVYTTANSELRNNRINVITGDGVGTIWIGSWGGLVKMVNQTMEVMRTENSNLPSNLIKEVECGLTDIWVVADTFLTRFDGTNFQKFGRKNNNIPNSNTIGVEIDAEGNTWAAFSAQVITYPNLTTERIIGGLGVYNNSQWQSVFIGDLSLTMNDLYVDRDGYKWIATSSGLFRFLDLNTSIAFRPNNSGILSQSINGLVEDSRGTLWIATQDGLAKYKKYLETK
ncbi:MAG: PEGA domain-containing protein [Ignavibacteriales bacterium]|jgi:ligand-binding sensor domain-containing protein|nr:MAG: PEGA domain-containing protein [Ignavibacteriales bacterium]